MAIAGRVAIVPRGAWAEETPYVKLDAVNYQGSSYVAKKSSVGVLPTDEEYWMLMVSGSSDEQIAQLRTELKATSEEVSKVKEDIANQVLIFSDVSVAVDAWTEDTTYTDYPYRADIPCEGVTADYKPEVTFDVPEAISGVYAPVAVTGAGVVSIYAKEIPADAIVIPTISCVKAVGA